jgi:transposase
MRRSFDGLALIARERLGADPEQGGLFVFCNKRRNRLKALWMEKHGYCLLYKRLHRALFDFPKSESGGVHIDAQQLALMLEGVNKSCRKKRS